MEGLEKQEKKILAEISLFYQVMLSLLLLLENIWDEAKAVLRGKYTV